MISDSPGLTGKLECTEINLKEVYSDIEKKICKLWIFLYDNNSSFFLQ